ncbi:hypothetical protein MPSEU_000095900 [Mayamaea pseudoterrestris]|nr:hypothetical protein MPSEU_000095900 [Mayamaea pseudoterrestris]
MAEAACSDSPAMISGQKRVRDGTHKNPYEGFTFEPISSTGRPGTPHCFFEESFRVKIDRAAFSDDSVAQIPHSIDPIVHRHANGLCVVTAGDGVGRFNIESIQMLAESSVVSRSNKAKKLQKRKGQSNSGSKRPMDILAKVVMKDGSSLSLPFCVCGSIVEVNDKLTPELLASDPQLDGFLAIMQPSGRFPTKT